ncbi:DNA polymerase III subunit delta [Bianquea renquensis]|uniref:DNA polymerase III subunit delta n=1 Tax=Bianquea renquensis TaxID=2763661 RepID=A0A926DRN8_9FIRM|nr:DNA polymerase III subunit delta [Bianquea renquensis]MBC8543983.1 DNA polymerase III subunit delta [Bianquea renquensis]
MAGIKEQLKAGTLGRLYLLYGEEAYLKTYYSERILHLLLTPEDEMMNCDVLEGSNASAEAIIQSGQTLPFLAEKRLILVRDSQAFKGGREFDPLLSFFEQIPETTVLVFVEEQVDKRSKLFKAMTKYGHPEDCSRLQGDDLARWTVRELKKQGKIMDGATARYFVELVGQDMNQLAQEMEKLVSLKGMEVNVTVADIDSICTASPQSNIFRMTDCIGNRQAKEALAIYKRLCQNNEPAYRIFYMIARQFRLLYKAVIFAQDHMPQAQMAKVLGVPPFAVGNYVAQGKKFSPAVLREILGNLLETDVAVKTGELSAEEAVELTIMRYASGR